MARKNKKKAVVEDAESVKRLVAKAMRRHEGSKRKS